MTTSTALLTDRYELTMLAASLRDGTASRPSVFELFSRRLSGGRRFGVVAGTGRLLGLLRDFRFGDDELRFLRDERTSIAHTVRAYTGDRVQLGRHLPRLGRTHPTHVTTAHVSSRLARQQRA